MRAAKIAGGEVVRTAILSGRRYEKFDSSEAFKEFAKQAWASLFLAEPILRRRRVKLAIENHKDWRIDEMTAMLRGLSSEFVGICFDTDNNIALLEDPLALAEALAPHACSIHLKDMGVEEQEDGFLIAEVPLGERGLELPRIVDVLRQAQPSLNFSLEMITRDPLKVPCLTEKFWATMLAVPGADLARTLAWVRKNKPVRPLPRVANAISRGACAVGRTERDKITFLRPTAPRFAAAGAPLLFRTAQPARGTSRTPVRRHLAQSTNSLLRPPEMALYSDSRGETSRFAFWSKLR